MRAAIRNAGRLFGRPVFFHLSSGVGLGNRIIRLANRRIGGSLRGHVIRLHLRPRRRRKIERGRGRIRSPHFERRARVQLSRGQCKRYIEWKGGRGGAARGPVRRAPSPFRRAFARLRSRDPNAASVAFFSPAAPMRGNQRALNARNSAERRKNRDAPKSNH